MVNEIEDTQGEPEFATIEPVNENAAAETPVVIDSQESTAKASALGIDDAQIHAVPTSETAAETEAIESNIGAAESVVSPEIAHTESTSGEIAVEDSAGQAIVEAVVTDSAVAAIDTEVLAQTDATPNTQSSADGTTDTPSVDAETASADTPVLMLPLADMTPEERFRATTRLIFLAPDVPPVLVRPRRNDFRQLDDMLDRQFSRERSSFDSREESEDREPSDSSQLRRRRRSTSSGASTESTTEEEPRRAPRQVAPITEPQRLKGSTRLEAKKLRRREGRDAGRRRRLVITESEFLARREAVDRQMVVRTTADRVQIGVLEDKVLVEHYVARSSENSLIGNVYLGRVQNVLPSMEAAFVDIGRGRNAVLYSGEVDWSEFEGSGNARRIENALKPGDAVLVQVTKDPVGHKGARLTSQISLPGRFLVYVPGGAMNGISRKLPDTERARLKKILKEVLPTGAGVIVRTAAEGATEEQVTGDVERLTRQWESIQQRVAKGGGPSLLHSEPDMLIKIVRDVFNEDFHRMVISGADTFETIENYLSQVAPELLDRVDRYERERDIFDEYRVNEQVSKALDRKVWLPSGGSLVIDRTEAMTVVDVNTGKFVGSGGNLEETVTKNNLESAEEIVRQLRLRDIGGIIVIDFIDMVLESNRDLVLRRLIECLSRDRTKHQVAEVTSLGLVQMTRKKLGLGLLESFSEPCEVCAGRGVIVHHEPVHKQPGTNPRNSSNSNNNKRKNSNQAASTPAAQQAHAITEESRSMLARIAAKTIPHSDEHEAETAEATHTPRSEKSKASTGRAPRENPVRQDIEVPTLSPQQLLDSVLDALPEAPAVGKRRTGSRRASSSQQQSDRTEVDSSTTADTTGRVI